MFGSKSSYHSNLKRNFSFVIQILKEIKQLNFITYLFLKHQQIPKKIEVKFFQI